MGEEHFIGSPVPLDDGGISNKKLFAWLIISLPFILLTMYLGLYLFGTPEDDKAYMREMAQKNRQLVKELEEKKAELKAGKQAEASLRAGLDRALSGAQQNTREMEKCKTENLRLAVENKEYKDALFEKRSKDQNYQAIQNLKKELARAEEEVQGLKKTCEEQELSLKRDAGLKNQLALKEKQAAAFQEEARAAHRNLAELTARLTELNRRAGSKDNALQELQVQLTSCQREMAALIARNERHWGKDVNACLAYYHCSPVQGQVVRLNRIGKKSTPIDIPTSGQGGRFGPHFAAEVFRIPCGLYVIELWQDGSRLYTSPKLAYFSPDPKPIFVVRPDGRRIPVIHPTKGMNVILLTGKGYEASYFAAPEDE